MNQIIVVHNLYKHYLSERKRITALHSVNLTIESGEIIMLTGPNGSGKTTLLKILCGLVLPTTGHILINEIDILKNELTARKLIGFCSNDERSFYGRLSLMDNLYFFGGLFGLSGTTLSKRITNLSGLFKISEYLNMPFQKCSSGYKQRALMARALLHDPDILIIDELNKSIDPEFAQDIAAILRRLSAEQKKTVIFSAHNTAGFESLEPRIIKLSKGSVLV